MEVEVRGEPADVALIITDPAVELGPVSEIPMRTNGELLDKLFPGCSVHHLSRRNIRLPQTPDASSLFFWSVHHCFNQHLPLALDPTVLWYVILHEVAAAVKQDPAVWAHLFTAKPDEKQIVRVEDNTLVYPDPNGVNNWATTIGLFDAKLTEFIPDAQTMNTMMPSFSTSTVETRVATLVTFMDAASPYFEYRVRTMCGIPQVRMNGSVDDWRLLATKAEGLAEMVPEGEDGDHMRLYFTHLLPTLHKLAAAREGETDLAWWRSLYKVSGGSGGPFILGWITTFLAFVQRRDGLKPKHKSLFDIANYRGFGDLTTEDFPLHVSKVDFLWEYLGREIPMHFAGGVLGVDLDDGFVTPRLGFGVLEAS